jgi:hypothetical protein
MKETLLKLREAYLQYVSSEEVVKWGICVGLCFSSYKFLSADEHKMFQEYLDKYKKRRERFYNSEGVKTCDSSKFLWKPLNSKVRLDWLDKQIAKL